MLQRHAVQNLPLPAALAIVSRVSGLAETVVSCVPPPAGGLAQARVACSSTSTSTVCLDPAPNVSESRWTWYALLPFAIVPVLSTSQAEEAAEAETNHPLDYNPVTNEHTARMTLARRAAMDAYNQGRYKEAERRFKEAVEAARLGFGANDPHVASCLNNLAEFYRNTANYDEAEPAYKQALQLLHDEYGDNHWLYVSALHNLALMYSSKGNTAAAVTALEQVLKLRERMFGPKHISYADTEFALAGVLLRGGKPQGRKRAIELMKHAVFVLEDSGVVEGTPILQWLSELSRALLQSKQLPQAEAYLRKTLRHMGDLHGELQAQASEVAEQLVAVLLDLGQLGEARRVLQQSAEARMHLYGRHLTVARSLANLAALWLQDATEGDLVVAEHFASSAADICRDLHSTAQRKGVLGSLFGARLNGERALLQLQVTTELCSALSLHASCMLRIKQPAAAVQLQRQACTCLQEMLGRVAPLVVAQQGQSGNGPEQATYEKLVSRFVDAKLQLLELLEKLAEQLAQLADHDAAEVAAVRQQANQLAQDLLGT